MIVYYSSSSQNTARFVAKLNWPNQTVAHPIDAPYVLFVPTYADGEGNHAVPKPVVRFLNGHHFLCRGVVGFGNRSFGATFALGGRVVAKKLDVALLHRVELAGTDRDVEVVLKCLQSMKETGCFWR